MEKKLICYCFGYSEGDIIRDVQAHKGTSTILEKIMEEKKKGSCRCSSTHPLGR